MPAIKAHFDGRVFVPDEPVPFRLGEQVVILWMADAVEGAEKGPLPDESPLRPILVPSDPDAARRLICDPESGLENS
jgi:hypothetical protein